MTAETPAARRGRPPKYDMGDLALGENRSVPTGTGKLYALRNSLHRSAAKAGIRISIRQVGDVLTFWRLV